MSNICRRSIFSVSCRGGGSRGTYSKASKAGDGSGIEDAAVHFFQGGQVSMELTPRITCVVPTPVWPLGCGKPTKPFPQNLSTGFVMVSLRKVDVSRSDHPRGPFTALAFSDTGSTRWKKVKKIPGASQVQCPSDPGRHHQPYYLYFTILPAGFLP